MKNKLKLTTSRASSNKNKTNIVESTQTTNKNKTKNKVEFRYNIKIRSCVIDIKSTKLNNDLSKQGNGNSIHSKQENQI